MKKSKYMKLEKYMEVKGRKCRECGNKDFMGYQSGSGNVETRYFKCFVCQPTLDEEVQNHLFIYDSLGVCEDLSFEVKEAMQ